MGGPWGAKLCSAATHRSYGRTAAYPEHFGDFGEGGFDLLMEARGTKC